jgi:hypothetical protein
MPRERLPQAGKRAQATKHAQAFGAKVGHQTGHRRPLRPDVGAFKTVVHLPCPTAKTKKPPSLSRTAECGYGIRRSVYVCKQVKVSILPAPCMAGEYTQRLHLQYAVQRGANFGQDFVKYPAHREHSRTGIDRHSIHHDLPHFSARLRRCFNQRHLQSLTGQQQGADQTADTGADDDHTVVAQRISHSNALSRFLEWRAG